MPVKTYFSVQWTAYMLFVILVEEKLGLLLFLMGYRAHAGKRTRMIERYITIQIPKMRTHRGYICDRVFHADVEAQEHDDRRR